MRQEGKDKSAENMNAIKAAMRLSKKGSAGEDIQAMMDEIYGHRDSSSSGRSSSSSSGTRTRRLSSLVVRKLRRKCTLAAEVEVEPEPPPLPSASRLVWESDGAVLCDMLSSDRTFIKHLSKLKHSHSARETIDRH